MCGLRWQSPILAAGRGRPGSEHLFILSPMQPRPEKTGDGTQRKVPSARCRRGPGGVSEPRGALLLLELPAQGSKVNSSWEAGSGGGMPAPCRAPTGSSLWPPYLKSL